MAEADDGDPAARLEARVQALEDALRFYADRENWKNRQIDGRFETGPAVDGGERARTALMWS